MNGLDPCASGTEWSGLTCSGSDVIEIDLYNNGLTGTISPDVDALGSLESLRLDNNGALSGTLPARLVVVNQLR